MVRTPPPQRCRTILTLQIWLKVWAPLHLRPSDDAKILQPPHRIEAHQHPEAPHGVTHLVTLYQAPHPALLAPPLLWAVSKTGLPPSLIRMPVQLLQIDCRHKLKQEFRDRGSGIHNSGQFLHLYQWSPAVAASIDFVTQTWHVLYLHRADSWSSTYGTDSCVWVQATWRW